MASLIARFLGTNMGPIWGRQDPVWAHVGPMNFAIWVVVSFSLRLHLKQCWLIVYQILRTAVTFKWDPMDVYVEAYSNCISQPLRVHFFKYVISVGNDLFVCICACMYTCWPASVRNQLCCLRCLMDNFQTKQTVMIDSWIIQSCA